MKRAIIAAMAVALLWGMAIAGDINLGVKKTSNWVSFPIQFLDSAGWRTSTPDSFHVRVWFERCGTGAPAYQNRSLTAPTWIKTVVYTVGDTLRVFADSVANIDGDSGNGAYFGIVTLYRWNKPNDQWFNFSISGQNDVSGLANLDAAVTTRLAPSGTLATVTSLTNPVTLAPGVHTGAVIPTVTAVTNDVGITQAGADKAWSTAARTLTASTLTSGTLAKTGDAMTIGAGGITANAFAANAITAGAIADGAIDSMTFANDAKTMIAKRADSLGTATAAAVWATGTKAVTSVANPVTTGSISNGAITTNAFTAGAINTAVAPNLDAAVSTRSTLTSSSTIGINWGNILNPTTTVALSGTTVGTATSVTNPVFIDSGVGANDLKMGGRELLAAIAAGNVTNVTGTVAGLGSTAKTDVENSVWNASKSSHTTAATYGTGVFIDTSTANHLGVDAVELAAMPFASVAQVTGNVAGSVGSVTGAVGSVTAKVTLVDSSAAGIIDSIRLSRILGRKIWGIAAGVGSDSTTWANRTASTAAGTGLDSATTSRIVKRTVWGVAGGSSGSDSVAWANRTANTPAGTGLDSATTSRIVGRKVWGVGDGSIGADSVAWANRTASTAAGTGLDSATTSRLLKRTIWGISGGSSGSDSTTASQREVNKVYSNGDKAGYSLTQAFPSNFSSFSIDGSGRVTVGSNADKTGYALTQTFPTNFSSLAITGGGYVTAGTVGDKTGYTLTQGFPTYFSSLAITAGGAVTAGTVQDKTGYTASTVSDKAGYSLSQTFPSNFSAFKINSYGGIYLDSSAPANDYVMGGRELPTGGGGGSSNWTDNQRDSVLHALIIGGWGVARSPDISGGGAGTGSVVANLYALYGSTPVQGVRIFVYDTALVTNLYKNPTAGTSLYGLSIFGLDPNTKYRILAQKPGYVFDSASTWLTIKTGLAGSTYTDTIPMTPISIGVPALSALKRVVVDLSAGNADTNTMSDVQVYADLVVPTDSNTVVYDSASGYVLGQAVTVAGTKISGYRWQFDLYPNASSGGSSCLKPGGTKWQFWAMKKGRKLWWMNRTLTGTTAAVIYPSGGSGVGP